MSAEILDFSNCPDGYRDYGGSDNKLSIEMNDIKYMLKLPEHRDNPTEFGTSSVNNVFSEYLGSHIIASLGLDVHETDLGLYHGKPAVACRDFTGNGYRLHEFSWLMRSMYDKSQIGKMPTYTQLYDVIRNHHLLHNVRDAAIERYWQTFVADALIGNFDRHKGNFGYLVNEETKDVKLAPIYDCGSCLYPNLSEHEMPNIINNHDEIVLRMYKFPSAALNMNDNPHKINKASYFEILSSDFDKNCRKAFLKLYPKINLDRINEIISSTPFLSDVRIEFYQTMLRHRKEMILDKAMKIIS